MEGIYFGANVRSAIPTAHARGAALVACSLCGVEVGEYTPPQEAAVEGIYFGANVRSAIPTAHARGAALVACSLCGVEVGEYTPMQIKQAVVGTGAANKTQVTYMVRTLLHLDHDPKPDHAADALACAV